MPSRKRRVHDFLPKENESFICRVQSVGEQPTADNVSGSRLVVRIGCIVSNTPHVTYTPLIHMDLGNTILRALSFWGNRFLGFMSLCAKKRPAWNIRPRARPKARLSIFSSLFLCGPPPPPPPPFFLIFFLPPSRDEPNNLPLWAGLVSRTYTSLRPKTAREGTSQALWLKAAFFFLNVFSLDQFPFLHWWSSESANQKGLARANQCPAKNESPWFHGSPNFLISLFCGRSPFRCCTYGGHLQETIPLFADKSQGHFRQTRHGRLGPANRSLVPVSGQQRLEEGPTSAGAAEAIDKKVKVCFPPRNSLGIAKC